MKKWLTSLAQVPRSWLDVFIDPFYSLTVVVLVVVTAFVWTSAEALVLASALRFDVHTVPQALVVLGYRTGMYIALAVCVWAVLSFLLTVFAFAFMSVLYGVGKVRGDKSMQTLFDL